MVAITVVLAVTVGFVVLDLGDSTSQNARAGVEMTETSAGVQVTATQFGGNTDSLQVLVNGQPVDGAVLTSAGDSVTVTSPDDATVSVRGTTSTESSSTVQSISTTSNTLSSSEPTLVESSGSGVGGSEDSSSISDPTTAPNSSEYNTILESMDGDGTVDSPYVITNVYELQAMQNDTDANYTLSQHIDASGTSEWNNASGTVKGFSPIRPFTGTFDGNGYEIRGVTVNRNNYVGVFGFVSEDSVIQNVGAVNVNMTGSGRVGGLVGRMEKNSVVKHSYSTGQVKGNDYRVGGLVGRTAGSSQVKRVIFQCNC